MDPSSFSEHGYCNDRSLRMIPQSLHSPLPVVSLLILVPNHFFCKPIRMLFLQTFRIRQTKSKWLYHRCRTWCSMSNIDSMLDSQLSDPEFPHSTFTHDQCTPPARTVLNSNQPLSLRAKFCHSWRRQICQIRNVFCKRWSPSGNWCNFVIEEAFPFKKHHNIWLNGESYLLDLNHWQTRTQDVPKSSLNKSRVDHGL